ncbi:hypothetical protein [uncultured Lamprocystis sp.]|nr:hypothetical protein [uncultured Lamprocystis sp.]
MRTPDDARTPPPWTAGRPRVGDGVMAKGALIKIPATWARQVRRQAILA